MKKVLIILFVLVLLTPSMSTIINIPADWPNIQLGINLSSNGDTVLVAPGVYFENLNFSGRSITLASHYLTTGNDIFIATTMINGSGTGNVMVLENSESINTLIYGLTIENGACGIKLQTGSATIEHCVIRNNSSQGIYALFGSESDVSDCLLSGNTYGFVAGTFSNNNSLDNCQFISNSTAGLFLSEDTPCDADVSNSYFYGNGYGVWSAPEIGSSAISNCEFVNNGTGAYGAFTMTSSTIQEGNRGISGGLTRIGNNNTCTNCTFTNLSDAAVYSAGTSTLNNCTFESNTDTIAYVANERYCTFNNCQFINNTGPGIYGIGFECRLYLNYCLFYGNSNGIYYSSSNLGTLGINHITFSDNNGPAIHASTDGSNITIENSIVSGNSGFGMNLSTVSGSITLNYNDCYDNSGGNYIGITDPTGTNGNISCDPMFCYADPFDYYLDGESCCAGEGSGGSDIGTYPVGCNDNYEYLPGDANMFAGQWEPMVIGADVTYLVNYFRGISTPCMLDGYFAAADANGDCLVIGSDVTFLVGYFRGSGLLLYCPDYPPAWPPLPVAEPSGWPNCD